MEPEGSSSYSQVPAICPYPDSNPSSLHPVPLSGTSGVFVYNASNFVDVFAKLLKATTSFVMSICPSTRINSVTTLRICMNFEIGVFFENLSRKSKLDYNLGRIMGTLHEDPCTFI